MVRPAARTGMERTKSIPVTRTDQGNIGTRSKVNGFCRMFMIVTIELMDPARDEVPAK